MEKRTMSLLMAVVLCMCLITAVPAEEVKAKTVYVTARDFITQMVKAAKVKADMTQEEPYVTAAIAAKLLNKGEIKNYDAAITKADAAVLVERTDELLHGTKYDEDLYRQIIRRSRISDLRSVPKTKRDAVIKVYGKGIMVGSFNGMFEASRKFDGKGKLTDAEAKTIVLRIKYPEKRKKFSPDGQLIRTTNLPKNASAYEYILANLPNSFYEKKFGYQLKKYYYKPVELVDYASPAKAKEGMFNERLGLTEREVVDQYLYDWCAMVEKNLTLRFNADYRTINNKWISELRKTYFMFGDEDDKKITDDIKRYVREMKKNKVIVKASKIVVEPSSLYQDHGEVLRVYVKFKVVSGPVEMIKGNEKIGAADLTKVIYSDGAYIDHFKKGVWLERYFDIDIGTINGNSTGADYAVINNTLSALIK